MWLNQLEGLPSSRSDVCLLPIQSPTNPQSLKANTLSPLTGPDFLFCPNVISSVTAICFDLADVLLKWAKKLHLLHSDLEAELLLCSLVPRGPPFTNGLQQYWIQLQKWKYVYLSGDLFVQKMGGRGAGDWARIRRYVIFWPRLKGRQEWSIAALVCLGLGHLHLVACPTCSPRLLYLPLG